MTSFKSSCAIVEGKSMKLKPREYISTLKFLSELVIGQTTMNIRVANQNITITIGTAHQRP